MRITLLLLVAFVGTTGLTAPPDSPPVGVFAALDGTWAGTFVGYDASGRELYRIRARHTYRTVSDTEQAVEIADTMPDGTVVTGRGVNSAVRGADGSVTLRCLVEKSNGERVDHAGRLVRGPDGQEQIVWFTHAPGRVETFREVVRSEGDRLVYEINGMGRYDDTLILMVGRYYKTGRP